VETIGSEELWNKKDNLEVTFEIKEKLKILELTLTPVYLNTKTIVFGVGTDITKRKVDEKKILNSLKEKELLLREIHHRVKNNLQIISTLLTLQSSQNNNINVEDLYRESQNRIQSISLIHENLYHSKDLANINFEIYTKGLITDLFDSYGVDSRKVKLNLDIDDITMGIETAIPCGLIINELVSNSLKHGFSDSDTGEVNVKLHRLQDGKFSLVISDTGKPFPENISLVNNETLGLELIKNLVNQLDAQLKFDREKKEFNIIFKELEYKERI
jgi:two-component system sensor kinase